MCAMTLIQTSDSRCLYQFFINSQWVLHKKLHEKMKETRTQTYQPSYLIIMLSHQ